jgi:formate dehydrogenase subunit gamma
MGMVKNNGTIFDSTKMENVVEKKPKRLPGYYFPLVIGILLVEAIILVLILLQILPIHVFEVYPFAQYAPYVSSSDVTQLSVTITRWFFFLLTAGVLLPTTLIIMLEVARRVFIVRKGDVNAWDDEFSWLDKLDKKKPAVPANAAERVKGDYITRFDVHQRIQHFALMGSFIILAVTGFLRGFPDWPTFQWFTRIFGGVEVLRLVHDIAAFIMIADGFYHLAYIGYGFFVKHKSPSAMYPKLKDLKDIIHTSLWIFGLHKHEPEYDHFQYGQKIDYWAIFWGMPVMVITGIIMMFASYFSQWVGGQWFAVLATAHRDEAVLAVGFILIVHMYYGHLQTSAFPMNTVMFTGKMLKSKYKQWFGREYEQITGEKGQK